MPAPAPPLVVASVAFYDFISTLTIFSTSQERNMTANLARMQSARRDEHVVFLDLLAVLPINPVAPLLIGVRNIAASASRNVLISSFP